MISSVTNQDCIIQFLHMYVAWFVVVVVLLFLVISSLVVLWSKIVEEITSIALYLGRLDLDEICKTVSISELHASVSVGGTILYFGMFSSFDLWWTFNSEGGSLINRLECGIEIAYNY